MNRFTTLNDPNVPISTLQHASLDHSLTESSSVSVNRFHRGPVPAASTQVDSIYNFYMKNKYFNTRIFQPTVI